MAKEKPELPPAARVLAKWASEANGQGMMPDWDPEFSTKYPNLWVFLTWRDVGGKGKLPGRLGMQVDGTGWRLTYSDPTAKRSLAVVASSLPEALAKLDLAVVAPDQPWTSRGGRNSNWKDLKK